MIKLDSVIGQPHLSDMFQSRTRGAGREDGAPERDVVSISEEGKKKHILGQLKSLISGEHAVKRGVDK